MLSEVGVWVLFGVVESNENNNALLSAADNWDKFEEMKNKSSSSSILITVF